ncbi:hypothetical protein, partial [Burkholderia ubonensis]|uniref:hypothetical protein n=1 Tax=Burkholderia ubonensis TaxID=101571 RepID=UPI001E337ADC
MNDAVDGMREMPASNERRQAPEPGRVSIVPRSAYSSLCRRVQLNAVYAHRFLIRHQSINACDSESDLLPSARMIPASTVLLVGCPVVDHGAIGCTDQRELHVGERADVTFCILELRVERRSDTARVLLAGTPHRDSCVRGGFAECESIGGDLSVAGNAKTPAGWAGVSGLREPDDYLLSHG